MSYTVLYRKWRPDNFSDVKGQDHIVTTLKNQINTDRIGHAYLFCGTRGTGKTTVAKILAKAVNCEHPVDGNPCGECSMCKAVSAGNSLNVIEIDAASNNGVDNIRQIREECEYRPTDGHYRVYIIDEVHMLSVGAFNALLKILEEPPSYVIFILATTEVHKIPVTILSRCQRYDFKRISVKVITDRLKELTTAEHVDIEERALEYIAKKADGGLRDALSLLDQCMSCYINEQITYDAVLEVLGTVDTEIFSRMLRLIVGGNVMGIIGTLDELIANGRDISQFVSDFTWYMRNLLLLKTSDEAEKLLDMSSENMQRLREEALITEETTIMRYIRILAELTQTLKFSSQKRVQTEVALIKMTRPQMETDVSSITERLNALEKLVGEKEDILALVAMRPEVPSGYVATEETRTKVISRPEVKALPEDVKMLVEKWGGILLAIDDILLVSYLKRARLSVEGDILLIVTDALFESAYMREHNAVKLIKEIAEQMIQKEVNIEIRDLKEGETFEELYSNIDKYVTMHIDNE